jgi:hypothetical protein
MAAATDKKLVLGRITLEDVRLSFADIWKPKSIRRKDGSESDPKFSANGLIDKSGKNPVTGKPLTAKYMGKRMPLMDALKMAKLDALGKKLGDDKAKTAKVKPENYAVRDGELENWDGYEGNWYISANNSKQPKLVGRDKRDLTQADGILYSGCYVNMVITLWCQLPGQSASGDPKPLAVFGSLEAIQFVRDGDAFGAAPVDVDDAFDDITDEDDELDNDDGDDEDVL